MPLDNYRLSAHFIILTTAYEEYTQSICLLSQYMNFKLRLINFHNSCALCVFKFVGNESLTGKKV
jgi:hypothetical protein